MQPVLYGRDAALGALRWGIDDALAGRGRVAVVTGEAGIGKSAVVTAIAAEAEKRGATVTWGRAWEFAEAPPYFPVWPCLRALGVGERGGIDDGDRAFQLWEAVAAKLGRASASSPSVWILEDLHAADLATLDLLTFLAQPLRAMRALVVVTARSSDARLTDRMHARLTRMARDGLDVRLEPLGASDVAAITEETVGRPVADAALVKLVELTGGNPLFVVECARAFRSAGGVEGTLGTLPPTVRQVVLDRVAHLPAATRRALAAGAILGREFSAASIARMDASLPARVIDALLPALRAGIVQETRPGQFLFSHALVHEAIEQSLAAEERAVLHSRAEVALATLGDAADVLVERARHVLAALPEGNAERALSVVDRATNLLERERGFDRAFELHARVEEARATGLLPPATGEQRLHVARIARDAGRSDASRRAAEEVMAQARAADDPELFARAMLLRAADIRPVVIDHAQVAMLEEGRARLGDRAPALGARVLARLATALQPAPDPKVPARMAALALERAKATGDEAAILEVLDVAKWGLFYEPIAEKRAWSIELLERSLRAGDLPKALGAHEWLAFQALEAGDFGDFDRRITTMLALSEDIGHPRHRWRPLLAASGRATLLGRFAEADRYVTEVMALAGVVDDPALAFSLAAHDVMRLRAQRLDERLPAALMALDSVAASAMPAVMIAASLRAGCSARAGDVEATRRELSVVRVFAPTALEDASMIPFLAEIVAVAGTEVERRRARAVLTGWPWKEVSSGQGWFHHDSSVVRLLGLLDLGLGDLDRAEAGLREARAVAIAHGQAAWSAQIAFELAQVLRRAGNEAAARELLAECASVARELGMTGLAVAAGLDPAPAPVEKRDLTMAREADVWRLERGVTVVRVRDSRGMQLLARLVGRPAEEIHVLALSSDEGPGVVESSAGEHLDEKARTTYRRRLAELEQDFEEAEQHGDLGRSDKLARERDFLRSELSRAVGLGGRGRPAGSATERARVNVQRRIKDALGRIAEADVALGKFLELAVSTGVFCSYRP